MTPARSADVLERRPEAARRHDWSARRAGAAAWHAPAAAKGWARVASGRAVALLRCDGKIATAASRLTGRLRRRGEVGPKRSPGLPACRRVPHVSRRRTHAG
jgi:hypothetical protein